MKTNLYSALTIAAALAVASCAASLRAAETNTTAARIGIYDSRAVACAWFWNTNQMARLNELMQNARAAKSAGDTNRFNELAASLRQQQDEIHREGFSTATPTKALAELKERLPEIQKSAGVAALVSKWDDAALKKIFRRRKSGCDRHLGPRVYHAHAATAEDAFRDGKGGADLAGEVQ